MSEDYWQNSSTCQASGIRLGFAISYFSTKQTHVYMYTSDVIGRYEKLWFLLVCRDWSSEAEKEFKLENE